MPDIMHLVKVPAAPERTYQALVTAEGIRHWWTPDADLDATVGGMGEFRFYGGKSVIQLLVTALTPPLSVSWKTVSAFRPEWSETTLNFDLQTDGQSTRLLFAHRGFKEADEIYALTTTGWGIYLGNLQRYLESGEVKAR